jgi:single-stranded-DNA-specific exonuclease
MTMIWNILEPNAAAVELLTSALGVEPLVAAVLVNRRITSIDAARSFLKPSLAAIRPPDALTDIEKAAARLVGAIVKAEKILIFGDYDVDGVTATALLLEFLRGVDARVSHYIPHRRREGYGLRKSHVRKRIIPGGYRLVITVDCGIASHDAVQLAADEGIDVIITDHHQPSIDLPRAVAVVNPKRFDCGAGLDHLAGVGMAFYLLIELRRQLRHNGFWQARSEPNLKTLCNLVALGTIADMVPLVDENRAFIHAGLPSLASRPGLKALMDISRVDLQRVESDDIAFRLAPRLNAAGRVAHANLALRLLTTDSPRRGYRLARVLDRLNSRRQAIETDIIDQIHRRIDRQPEVLDRQVLVMAERNWHDGVLGIVAARLARVYYRPVILLSRQGDLARGSARSIPGIDLHRILSACEAHLDHYGGHAMAAGLVLPWEALQAFEKQLLQTLAEQTSPEDYRPRLALDAEIRLHEITPRLLDQLESLQPFGQAMPEPLFMVRDSLVESHRVVGGHHRQMALRSRSRAETKTLQAIQFRIDPAQPPPHCFRRLAVHLRWNRWNGTRRPQLVIAAVDP